MTPTPVPLGALLHLSDEDLLKQEKQFKFTLVVQKDQFLELNNSGFPTVL